jgi:hypothetical protein
MVACDQIRKHTACITKPVTSQDGASRGMGGFTGFPFDMRVLIETTGQTDVALKTSAVFA